MDEIDELKAEVERLKWLSNTYFVRQEILSFENELLRGAVGDEDLLHILEQTREFSQGGKN
jgi:hypothetical protein